MSSSASPSSSSPPPPPPRPPKPAKPQATATSPAESESDGAEAEAKVADILALNPEDESLRKYKESLLGSAAHGDLGDTSDPRKLIIEEFRVVFAPEEGLPDIVHSLRDAAGVQRLAREGVTMREGVKFKFRITFRVQHVILAGIKFVNTMTRMMLSESEELMLGSYPPSSAPHVFEFPKWDYNEAPKGMMFRGKYKVKNSFVDSSKHKHLEFEYECNIVKE